VCKAAGLGFSFAQVKRIRYTAVLFLFAQLAQAQPINIGLFTATDKTKLSFVPENCHYLVMGDDVCLDTLKTGVIYNVCKGPDSSVRLFSLHKQYPLGKEFTITAMDSTGELRFKAATPNGKDKVFDGDFKFKIYKDELCVMNYIDLDTYIEAVIESESGLGHSLEYYKVQAVISRTYARSNAFKHVKEEGYNLCDHTHCQAYKHKGKANPLIVQAVRETKGVVMVDDSLILITASFHSNCGGQTANSETVWSKQLPYLRSINDTYCESQRNAHWQKQIPLNDWLSALKMYGMNTNDSSCRECAQSFTSAYRKNGITCNGKTVAFKTLRTHFKLKSAFFNVSMVDAHTVQLDGRGFGHGVGLCQEGAMKMAKNGKTYKEILNYYFTGVHVVNLDEIKSFSEE